ncbi:MAG: hypothetical protein JWN28_651 [Candidatus Saccharibacteria bacterium]|nr:hypothetical protein [Candidatus Saccharibacteria bacterium]
MNEITRIHIAKVAYDIEIGAKKQLETYIHSLETYTQDKEVLADIEIRITELLGERNVVAGGVIGTDDVAAIRKQLGEPYEFADTDGDIAVGALEETDENHRLYRNIDTALFGGVLGGMATYFKVNALWTRLAFIILTFISFGTAILLYAVLWIIIPPARTAAEKLKLAGKPVTLESIRELNVQAETEPTRSIAPKVQRVFMVGIGIASIIAAATIFIITIGGAISVLGHNGISTVVDQYLGAGYENSWLVWLVFWLVVAGALLLAALFLIIAYAFIAKKVTKRMIVSGIVIISLGLLAVAVSGGIAASQSWRASSEAQALVKTTKMNLPKDMQNVRSVVFADPTKAEDTDAFTSITSIQYIVDEGAPRYELTALPKAKASIVTEGTTAHVDFDIPEDYRNSYVQSSLIIYGPALESITSNGVRLNYSNTAAQDTLKLTLAKQYGEVNVDGKYQSVVIEGKGNVDVSSSAIQSLDIRSDQDLRVTAGTVRTLIVTQPDVCASSSYGDSTTVTVFGVTSGMMTYNGAEKEAKTYKSNCASVTIGEEDMIQDQYKR